MDEISLECRVAFILDFASGEIANEAPLEGGMLPREDECDRLESVDVDAMADEAADEVRSRREVDAVVERSMAGEGRARERYSRRAGERERERARLLALDRSFCVIAM